MLPSEFLADFFRDTTGSLYLCSLPNDRGAGKPAEICGRGNAERLDELVRAWDRNDRGTFFCINTVMPRQSRRAKETIFELVCLHTDLDLEKIDMGPGEVLTRLGQIPCLPSKVIHSGHGYHCYWILKEPEQATPRTIDQTEILLRALANVLGGDPAVCEVARLMRLPGSHNTKNGDRLPVTVIADRPIRYDLSDLGGWLELQRPLIPRKGAAPSDNPFLAADIPGAGGAPVNIESRLASMQFKGSGDSSIHQTQLAVCASLLNRGVNVDETVRTVLESTQRAAGEFGKSWDWAREERDVRAMCRSWARKKANGGSDQAARNQLLRAVTMETVGTKEYRPMEFLVPDLIPAEGVTLICGRPKDYKSFLLYDICLSTALGRELLGGRRPRQGFSLYLALEDSERRLRHRGERLLERHIGSWPVNMSVATECDRVDAGGLDQIRDWVLGVRAAGGNVVCVAIDVLMMIRPAGRDKQQAYQRDYEAIQGLRALAQELGISILIAHHTRKSSADDAQDTISGTLGLAAAADCNIVISRQEGGGFVLDVRGRDVESQQLAAVFDKSTLRWTVAGDAAELRQSESRRLISDALSGVPEGMTPSEIAAETDLKPSTVRMTLLRMRHDGRVARGRGKYTLTSVTV